MKGQRFYIGRRFDQSVGLDTGFPNDPAELSRRCAGINWSPPRTGFVASTDNGGTTDRIGHSLVDAATTRMFAGVVPLLACSESSTVSLSAIANGGTDQQRSQRRVHIRWSANRPH
ncbi:hypothetical protein [Paracoccus pacificus]|uniref:Uncharacterized protein n=1 Tax=Paracoccus pacificus TaxID=1463598 RepID=A0ABW4R321_9RHOB